MGKEASVLLDAKTVELLDSISWNVSTQGNYGFSLRVYRRNGESEADWLKKFEALRVHFEALKNRAVPKGVRKKWQRQRNLDALEELLGKSGMQS